MWLPILDYADIFRQNTSDTNLRLLNVIYTAAFADLFSGVPTELITVYINEALRWSPPQSRRHHHWLQFIFKCYSLNYPPCLKLFLIPFRSPDSLKRTEQLLFSVPEIRKVFFVHFTSKLHLAGKNLPSSVRSINSFHLFKTSVLRHLQTVSAYILFVYTVWLWWHFQGEVLVCVCLCFLVSYPGYSYFCLFVFRSPSKMRWHMSRVGALSF